MAPFSLKRSRARHLICENRCRYITRTPRSRPERIRLPSLAFKGPPRERCQPRSCCVETIRFFFDYWYATQPIGYSRQSGGTIYLPLECAAGRENKGYAVSRLWDLLKKVEQYEAEISDHSVPGDCDVVVERRCGERLWLFSPVLVYGHTTESEPFHEGTEGLHVNAGGGLITLTTSVTKGQRLLLINKLDQEQECRVVCERSKHLTRAAVAVEFLRPVTHFWTAEH
jgi:hypothetical protein